MTLRWPGTALELVAALAFTSCSGSSGQSGDGAPDGGMCVTGPSGDVIPGTVLCCPRPAMSYCIGAGDCQIASGRMLHCPDKNFQTSELACDSYDVLKSFHIDFGSSEFYDSKTGALVAVLSFNNGGTSCLAGPPEFTVPSCHEVSPQCGGTDGGPTD